MADFGIQQYLANSSRERESDKVEYVMIDHDLWSWVMWFFVGPSLWQSLPSLGKDSSLPPTPINQKLNRYLNSNSLFLWFTKTYHGKKQNYICMRLNIPSKHYLPNKIISLHEFECCNLYQSHPLWAKWMPSEEITHLWLNKLVQIWRPPAGE